MTDSRSHWRTTLIPLVAVIVGLLNVGLPAQSPRGNTFEVVSIKKRIELLQPPITNVIKVSMFRMPQANVAMLVQFGWQIREFQLVGGPDWMWNDWFNVEAKAASDMTTLEEIRSMVRTMLEERFGLRVRQERRDIGVFTLERASADGELGRFLQPWPDCSKPLTTPPPSFPGEGSSSMGCGRMSDLAQRTSMWTDKPVIDATGLVGTFRWAWYIDNDPEPVWVNGVMILSRSKLSDAMKDYLGLTLKDARRPFDVLVIDSLQQPVEN